VVLQKDEFEEGIRLKMGEENAVEIEGELEAEERERFGRSIDAGKRPFERPLTGKMGRAKEIKIRLRRKVQVSSEPRNRQKGNRVVSRRAHRVLEVQETPTLC
jgi:hypothetical protein